MFTPPEFIYDAAQIFAVEDKLPPHPDVQNSNNDIKLPIEIRAFDGVPMANIPAVVPKTKLVFQPADAFVFDSVTMVSLLATLGSQKFDNPRLDIIALISTTLWLVRTVLRYSNKLARYDLVVKKFLSSKIAHRNLGALKYLADESALQRATRAALVHEWLQRELAKSKTVAIDRLVEEGSHEVNALLATDRETIIDIRAALKDLEKFGLIQLDHRRKTITKVTQKKETQQLLQEKWIRAFES